MTGALTLTIVTVMSLTQPPEIADSASNDRPSNHEEISSEDGGSFEISWHTIDAGGGMSIGGDFQLVGTIGQSDAGFMSGGVYDLAGGFWAAASDPQPKCQLADLNCDGGVDVSDLLIILAQWGPCGETCAADLNNDGAVDVADLLLLLSNWG